MILLDFFYDAVGTPCHPEKSGIQDVEPVDDLGAHRPERPRAVFHYQRQKFQPAFFRELFRVVESGNVAEKRDCCRHDRSAERTASGFVNADNAKSLFCIFFVKKCAIKFSRKDISVF